MNKVFSKRNAFRVSFVFVICAAVFITTGCEPLRKKFVRKKKEDEEMTQITAILDPQDYPEKIKSAAELYKEHYNLWRIWQNDLLVTIDEDRGERKALATISDMREQMKAMRSLLAEDKRSAFDAQNKDLNFLESKFQNNVVFRNNGELSTRVRYLGRNMQDHFSPEKIKDSLVPVNN